MGLLWLVYRPSENPDGSAFQINCLKTGNTSKENLRFATLSPIFFRRWVVAENQPASGLVLIRILWA
jgi:hypothetical protein